MYLIANSIGHTQCALVLPMKNAISIRENGERNDE